MRLTLNQRPRAVTKARNDADMTKTALARAVGCSLSLISEIEGGTRNAKPELLARIAAATNVPVERLTAGDQEAGEAPPPADGAVPELPDAERSAGQAEDVPELRGGAVERSAS